MTYAIIFNGQGAYYQGMALDILNAYPALNACAEDVENLLGLPLRHWIREEPERFEYTRDAQVAIALASMIQYYAVAKYLPSPDYVGGLSLGEYSAMMAAGMLDSLEGMQLLRSRGEIMSSYCQEQAFDSQMQMAAIIGVPVPQIQSWVQELHSTENPLYIANYNSREQTVLAGSIAAIQAFRQRARQAGYKKIIPLKVEGPFHSPLMRGCQDPYRHVLEQIDFHPTTIPVISNVTVTPHTQQTVRMNLVDHLVNSVHWAQTIEYLKNNGVQQIIQIGPGNTLAQLLSRDGDNIPCYVVDSVADVERIRQLSDEGVFDR